VSSTDPPGDGLGPRHLLWIVGAAAAGFLASYVFADLLRLPAAMYHLVYFVLVSSFVGLYAARTGVSLRATLRRRLGSALLFGALGGLALTRRVLADSPSPGPQGLAFAWDLLWRGLIYGALDGVLLSAFPWLVTWRALGGESSAPARRVGISGLALALALVVTSAYHLGYADFRGPKLLQANIGNAIATVPTLLSRNPLASPLAHAILHVTAVMHNPQSDLFLPPHELRSVRSAGIEGTVETTSMAVVDFPLRGTWRVFQPPGHAPYAFDFVGATEDGRYVSRSLAAYIFLAGPTAHWVGWSQPVHAPLDGTVVAASDGWPDRDTVNLIRDVLRPFLIHPKVVGNDIRPFAGNYVVIEGGPIVVFLAASASGLREDVGRPACPDGRGHRGGRELGQLAGSARSFPGHGRTGPTPGADPSVPSAPL
jgi:hypothetical protein